MCGRLQPSLQRVLHKFIRYQLLCVLYDVASNELLELFGTKSHCSLRDEIADFVTADFDKECRTLEDVKEEICHARIASLHLRQGYVDLVAHSMREIAW